MQNLITGASYRRDEAQLRGLYSTGFIFMAVVIAALMLIFFVFGYVAPWERWFPAINGGVAPDAQLLYCVLLLSLGATVMGSICSATLNALQAAHEVQQLLSIGAILSLVTGALAYYGQSSLTLFVLVTSPVNGLVMLVGGVITLRRHDATAFTPSLNYVSAVHFRAILPKASHFVVVQLCTLLMFNIDVVVIGHVVSLAAVTPYSIAMRCVSQVSSLFNIMLGPLWSAYASAREAHDLSWIKSTHSRLLLVFFLVYSALAVGGFFIGSELLGWWFGIESAPSRTLLLLVILYWVLRQWADIHSYLVSGLDLSRQLATCAVIHSIVTVILMWVGVKMWGVYGVIGAMIAGYVLVSGWVLPMHARTWLSQKT